MPRHFPSAGGPRNPRQDLEGPKGRERKALGAVAAFLVVFLGVRVAGPKRAPPPAKQVDGWALFPQDAASGALPTRVEPRTYFSDDASS